MPNNSNKNHLPFWDGNLRSSFISMADRTAVRVNRAKYAVYISTISFLLLLLPAIGKAQTLAPAACQQFFSASGIPLAGGFLYSYTAGTSTPTPTYADSAASIPNSNPIILNAGGYPVSATGGCGIWLSSSVSYKFVVQNSTHTAQWTVDNISTSTGILTSANTWSALQTFSAGITGTGNIGGLILGSGALAANNTWTGSATFTGALLPRSVDTATIYADQLTPSSGLCSVTGSDASAKIQCAINLLPANGGVVNAVNLSDSGGTGSTTIDPGAKSVTLYLGPYTYFIQQVVLETNFHIIGMGTGSWGASSTSTTVLQACATCAATNSIVMGTNGGNGGPVQHVLMDSLRVYGATSDTAIGMNLKTVNGANTGLWYSTFRNLCIGECGPSGASANGFSGGTIILDATAANTINQFLDFYNVQAFHTAGGSYALGLLGTNGQMNFTQCQFDGPSRNDGSTVVQLSNTSGNGGPYSITFVGATVQHGTLGVNIAGAQNITFIGTHFETVGEGIQINVGASSISSTAINFIDSTCQNFCGNNSSAGWWAKNLSPSSGTGVKFFGNQIQSSVDAVYVGFSNYQGFVSIADEESTTGSIAPQASIGPNIPLLTSLTTTSGTSDNVTVTGMTSSGHCLLTATNASAATNTATTYVSAKTTNQITVTHTGTASMTYDVLCTPN